MSDTRNLGQIQAVSIGDAEPATTTMIWHNPSRGSGLWLAYNYQTATWQAFAGEHRERLTGGSAVVITHNLGCQYPGAVLAFNGSVPERIDVVDYTDENTLTVHLYGDADVVIRP